MPLPQQQWTDFLSCFECNKEFNRDVLQPYSLPCGHTLCKPCYTKCKHSSCPHDQFPVPMQLLPVNQAIYQLLKPSNNDSGKKGAGKCLLNEPSYGKHYDICVQYINSLALYLKSIKKGVISQESELTRPMQRKMVNLINCQIAHPQGRVRLLKCIRAIAERCATELLLLHQNPVTLSTSLWAAVRSRGCQFLGPAMQEEALNLILLALEDGSELSRKVLVILVVKQLRSQFPQASKTSLGHVVQLLYRASCFYVTKREGESSLMKLKENFRSYDALRREHDSQIVQIAQEAGLRIAADQWSALLYGDQDHKPYMQSIIDKLQSGVSFEQSVQDFSIALRRTNDPGNLHHLLPDFTMLAGLSFEGATDRDWELLISCLYSVTKVIEGLVDFSKNHSQQLWQEQESMLQSAKYKTSFCRDIKNKGKCPRGSSCCFAHSQDELQYYRSKHKKAGGFYELTDKAKLKKDIDKEGFVESTSDQNDVESFPIDPNSEGSMNMNCHYPKCVTPLPQPQPTMQDVRQTQMFMQRSQQELPNDPNVMHSSKDLPLYNVNPAQPSANQSPSMHHQLNPPNYHYDQYTTNQHSGQRDNMHQMQQQQPLIPRFTVTVSFASNPNVQMNQPGKFSTNTMQMPGQQVTSRCLEEQHMSRQQIVPQQLAEQQFMKRQMAGKKIPDHQFAEQLMAGQSLSHQQILEQQLIGHGEQMPVQQLKPQQLSGQYLARHQMPNNIYPTQHTMFQQQNMHKNMLMHHSMNPSSQFNKQGNMTASMMHPQTNNHLGLISSESVKRTVPFRSTPPTSAGYCCISTSSLSSPQVQVINKSSHTRKEPALANPHSFEQQTSPVMSAAHYKSPLEAAAMPSTSVLNQIELASVQQLRRRKDEILSKLIRKQSLGHVDVQSSANATELERFYSFWDSITNVNVVDNIVMMDNEDVTDALVNVMSDLDTRTAPVMMRNTHDCGNNLSNIKPYRLNSDASKFDVKNAPEPLSALIYYSAGQESDIKTPHPKIDALLGNHGYDDDIIPFSDQATVSKYGPIARRIATRTINTELMQVTAHTDTGTTSVKAETAEENLQFANVDQHSKAEDLKNKNIHSYLGNEYAMSQLHASVAQTKLTQVPSSNREPIKSHPPIPQATGAMTNSNLSPTQAASTIQLLQREENAMQMHYTNREVPEDLQLAVELQSIELSIHKKIHSNN